MNANFYGHPAMHVVTELLLTKLRHKELKLQNLNENIWRCISLVEC